LGGLVSVARESSRFGMDFQMYLKQRLAETTDPILRQRLMDAAEVVRTSQPIAVECCKNELENPSTENKAKKDRALRVVITALQEIVSVIAASAKYINDFSLLFDLPPEGFLEDRDPDIEGALARLEHAVKKGDQPGTATTSKDLLNEVRLQVKQTKDFINKIPVSITFLTLFRN
jgi:hypothetical protein